MNQQYVYAGAQIISFNPILNENQDKRLRYFEYLSSILRLIRLDRRKYATAEMKFYRNKLCYESELKDKSEKSILEVKYAFLIPFDLALIVAHCIKPLSNDKVMLIIRKMRVDFNLTGWHEKLLKTEFDAASGNEKSWEKVLRNKELREFHKYLHRVKENTSFIIRRPYNILITATMSAGKSTFINALVGKNISLAQNLACTSKIHTIMSKPFEDGATSECDHDLVLDAKTDILLSDNEENRTQNIIVGTYFNSVLGGCRVVLLDSPGVNSSENIDHMEVSQRMIRSRQYKLLIYVLNATQLGTTDDESHLEYVAKNIGRTKVLFLLNKIDQLLKEDENLTEIIAHQKGFLESKGFKNPVICPISARAAYLAKKSKQIHLSRYEKREFEGYVDRFEDLGLATYYEKQLNCRKQIAYTDEEDKLYRNCGFLYLEQIIVSEYQKEIKSE